MAIFHPLKAFRKAIEDWDTEGCELHYRDPDAPTPLRVRFAWRCQGWMETGQAIRVALASGKKESFPDSGDLPRWERGFYRTKAALCLLIGRNGGHLDDHVGYKRTMDSIPVAYYDVQEYGTPDGTGGSCEEVHVGTGLFRNWFSYIEHESWP